MASAPKFVKPVVVSRPDAKAPKLPSKDDPELGERSGSPESVVSVPESKPAAFSPPANRLFQGSTLWPTLGKGRHRRTRKHKKTSKRTQKRRAKK